MASSSCRILFFLLAVASSSTAFQLVGGGGRKVGGRTEVPHVESNKEVQDLGLFCVEEYNHRLRGGRRAGSEALTFLRVVAAERQVVSGIKYYLKISARDGRERTFDAIVVVKPWLKSRSLLSFTPSAHH
ncbi:cysteine proteinase inhibitor 5 [Cocos nucifera]|uniref:Cysteine proteinase inhibitor 5 n=1 Tax=Cocos nucifera TaxID=13894 RepID=A0A8K0MX64_COCNU|nr:cysteine proteinase inhibitor 5 [Cocos nucifera]